MTIEITVSLKEDGRQKSLSDLFKEVAEKLRAKIDLYSQNVRLNSVKRVKGKLIVKYIGLAPVIEGDQSNSSYQEFDEEDEKTEDDFIGFLNNEKLDNPLL